MLKFSILRLSFSIVTAFLMIVILARNKLFLFFPESDLALALLRKFQRIDDMYLSFLR